jgi:transmembrane sensor
MEPKKGVTHIASRVQHVLADDPDASDEIKRGRAAFIAEVERRNARSSARRGTRPGRRYWLPLGFAASLAAGAAGLWFLMRAATFQVGEAREGSIGDVIEAVDGSVVPVSFSEGSTLMLHHGGRIRVLSLEAGATRVLVEDGVVDTTIVHRKTGRTKWEFDAGAYRVTVNGTKFRMAYASSSRALRVSTEEGQVTVTGGSLEKPRVVSAGQSLTPAVLPREAPAVAGSSEPVTAAAPAGASAAASSSAAPPEQAPSTRPSRGQRWQELIGSGQLLEGLRAAERADFEQVCETATLKELLALAEAGRFYGPIKRAVAALGVLRRRFPRSSDAGTAAFTLGRIAMEKSGAYSQAASWFETYLREQPNGPLMGDAFGRLMEARSRAGDGPGARSSAQEYLRRFPAGPYATEARDILSK